ncbi:MAG: hypothetical protein PHT78_11120 [Desulfitobacteriaceae bacterium]|jgi:phage FluMu protein Com|nr:hypothetical protein [Desulfitobacteriaceae bacterium]
MAEQVKCQNCGRRLFDKDEDAMGEIFIKCPNCRNVLSIKLNREVKKTKRNNCAIPSKGVS